MGIPINYFSYINEVIEVQGLKFLFLLGSRNAFTNYSLAYIERVCFCFIFNIAASSQAIVFQSHLG